MDAWRLGGEEVRRLGGSEGWRLGGLDIGRLGCCGGSEVSEVRRLEGFEFLRFEGLEVSRASTPVGLPQSSHLPPEMCTDLANGHGTPLQHRPR